MGGVAWMFLEYGSRWEVELCASGPDIHGYNFFFFWLIGLSN